MYIVKNILHSRISKVYTTEIHSKIFWPSNSKASHFYNINSLAFLKFGKHGITNKTLLNHFPAAGLWMPCAPLTW